MITNIPKTKPFRSVLVPSGIGVVFYVTLAAVIVFLHQFVAIKQYLQLPHDLNVGRMISTALDTALTQTIGETRTQALVVGLFWAIVGLGVYLFLRGVARLMTDLGEGYDGRGYMWPKGTSRNQALREAMERNIFRILAFIGLLIALFGPLSQVLSGPPWVEFIGPSVPLQLTIWFFAILAVVHLCVVLLRLTVLRPRLFG